MCRSLVAGFLFCFSWLSVKGAIQSVNGFHDANNHTDANTMSTLEQVHLIIRHGPRTPVNTYPKDPYLNARYEPYGWGQLTNAAKVELYKIGDQLRKRYRDILPPYYQSDIIHAQATQSSRTIMSLQMVLAALFPPKNTPMEWNTMLNWQPIPIYTESEETDKRLRQQVPCARYDEAVWEVMHLPDVMHEHEQNTKLLQDLSDLTGLNVSYTHDVTNIFISLQAQEAYGLKMPKWTKNYFPDKMRSLAAKSYLYDAYTAELRKLKGGFFLENMFDQMQSYIDKNLDPAVRKMFISCAHDWTISNILSALKVWPEMQMPRFSALIAIELRRRKEYGDFFVEIYFQNDPSKPPQLLQVPGCKEQCPIEQLLELSKDILPDASYEELCSAKGTSDGTLITYH